jgi:hypothetical protein
MATHCHLICCERHERNKSFLVERTDDHRVAKFYIKGGG